MVVEKPSFLGSLSGTMPAHSTIAYRAKLARPQSRKTRVVCLRPKILFTRRQWTTEHRWHCKSNKNSRWPYQHAQTYTHTKRLRKGCEYGYVSMNCSVCVYVSFLAVYIYTIERCWPWNQEWKMDKLRWLPAQTGVEKTMLRSGKQPLLENKNVSEFHFCITKKKPNLL